ncbi:hypothetical protein AMTRI_Chr13g118130 [Amborella trichopoda]
MAKKPPFPRNTLAFFFSLLLLHSIAATSDVEYQSLMAFKSYADPSNSLTSWTNRTSICTWFGISCLQNRVTKLVLESQSLKGRLLNITDLTNLRVLSLSHNQLYGHIPDLSSLSSLRLLFLSHNNLSGQIPAPLPTLFRLDLSYNSLGGQIPASLGSMTQLLTLRLESNHLTGSVSEFLNLTALKDFNVSYNQLSGNVPENLAVFPITSFSGNPSLCGNPLARCPIRVAGSVPPASAASSSLPATIVSSTPGSEPDASARTAPPTRHGAGRLTKTAVIAIVAGDLAVVLILTGIFFCLFWRKIAGKPLFKRGGVIEGEKIVYSSSPYGFQGGFERGKVVFLEGENRFEIDDLLKASAEMLGKGGFGTAYKAVLEDGQVVTVKRLKEAQVSGRREFEAHMDVLGRLRHPNLVSLRAYYFARDEKLLVYDYMPNGSLFSLLHGNRGPGRTPLDWTTRMRIAAGAAHGLAFLHHHRPRLAHGNVRSTNILLDATLTPRLSDFCLFPFCPPIPPPQNPQNAHSSQSGRGYKAPELTDRRKASQKADVYAFGVLLLEILTGKWPEEDGGTHLVRWVQSVVREEWTAEVFDLELMRYKGVEEEMVGLLQVALACAAHMPEQRPRMSHVLRSIEEIRGERQSPSHDSYDDSVMSDSPSVSEDAGATSQ